MAYDEKLRRRAVQYKDSGHTFAEVYEAFGIRPRSYYVWKAELEEKGKLENHYPKSRKGKTEPERLKEMAGNHPDWYLREFVAEFGVCFQATDKRGSSRLRAYPGKRPGWTGIRFRQIITAQANSTRAR